MLLLIFLLSAGGSLCSWPLALSNAQNTGGTPSAVTHGYLGVTWTLASGSSCTEYDTGIGGVLVGPGSVVAWSLLAVCSADPKTGDLLAEPLLATTVGAGFSPEGELWLVGEREVTVVNGTSLAVLGRVALPAGLTGVGAMSIAAGRVLVACRGTNNATGEETSVVVIDAAARAVVRTTAPVQGSYQIIMTSARGAGLGIPPLAVTPGPAGEFVFGTLTDRVVAWSALTGAVAWQQEVPAYWRNSTRPRPVPGVVSLDADHAYFGYMGAVAAVRWPAFDKALYIYDLALSWDSYWSLRGNIAPLPSADPGVADLAFAGDATLYRVTWNKAHRYDGAAVLAANSTAPVALQTWVNSPVTPAGLLNGVVFSQLEAAAPGTLLACGKGAVALAALDVTTWELDRFAMTSYRSASRMEDAPVSFPAVGFEGATYAIVDNALTRLDPSQPLGIGPDSGLTQPYGSDSPRLDVELPNLSSFPDLGYRVAISGCGVPADHSSITITPVLGQAYEFSTDKPGWVSIAISGRTLSLSILAVPAAQARPCDFTASAALFYTPAGPSGPAKAYTITLRSVNPANPTPLPSFSFAPLPPLPSVGLSRQTILILVGAGAGGTVAVVFLAVFLHHRNRERRRREIAAMSQVAIMSQGLLVT
jgi:hypothetical protein